MSRRRSIGIAILAIWVASLGWLAVRTVQRRGDLLTAGARLAPAAASYAVEVGDRQVGFATHTADTSLTGFTLDGMLSLQIGLGDSTARWTDLWAGQLRRSLALVSLNQILRQDPPTFRTSIRIDSTRGIAPGPREVALRWDTIPLTPATPSRTGQAPDLPVLPEAGPYHVVQTDRLQPGRSMPLLILDLADQAVRLDRITVVGEGRVTVADSARQESEGGPWIPASSHEVAYWRVVHAPRGLPRETWIDSHGNTVALHEAFGVSYRETAWEIARDPFRGLGTANAVDWQEPPGSRMLLAARRRTLDSAPMHRYLIQWPHHGMPLDSMARAALVGGRQALAGDTLTVTRRTPDDSLAPPPGFQVQYLIPGGAPEVAAITEEVLAGVPAGDHGTRLRRLARWVARSIRPDTTVSAPLTPADVLAARAAGADGMARLLAALVQADRIPARVVSGLAVTAWGLRGHAWVEAWLGGWVAADPATGMVPASAALVRFREGGRSRPIDLVPLLGGVRLDPLTPRNVP